MTIQPTRYTTIFSFLLATLFTVSLAQCGGSSSGSSSSDTTDSTDDTTVASGDMSLSVTVTKPTSESASLSQLMNMRTADRDGIYIKSMRIEEAPEAGMIVHAELVADATESDSTVTPAGTEVGIPTETAADGTCIIEGLTAEQIKAGVILIAEDSNGVPMHALAIPDSDDVDDAESTGEPLEATISVGSDLGYATIQTECPDGIAACITDIDPICITEAVGTMVDNDPETDSMGGYAAGLGEAHAAAIAAATVDQVPLDLMEAAMGGSPALLEELTGATVADVPVADALENFGSVIAKIKEAYCAPDESTGVPAWQDIRTTATSAGEEFDHRALFGIFSGFTPGELPEFESREFRDFGKNLPNLTGGFVMFGSHPEARQAAMENFRLGAFKEQGKVGPALGMLAAGFPQPPNPNDWKNMQFSGFDPGIGARAAFNGMLTMFDGDDGAAFTDFKPKDFYDRFNGVLSDSSNRQAWAVGGSGAMGDFMGEFIRDPQNFHGDDFTAFIKAPPGSSCNTSEDCLPCDSCVSGTCTSLSTKMGASCEADDDCDDITSCVGGFMEGRGGNCMCQSGIPTGAFVHSGAGSFGAFGEGGDFRAPEAGNTGALCGQGLTACTSGLSCSDPEHGVCLPGTFKKGPFAPCTSGSQCESDQCNNNMCATFSANQITTINTAGGGGTIGSRPVGSSCSVPSDCATFFCQASVCASPPETFEHAIIETDLKADGASCTYPFECESHFCGGSPATCQTGSTITGTGTVGFTPPSNLPAGAFCAGNAECTSASCNITTHQCR